MTEFTPSAAQAAAIAEVRDWFENRTDTQQVFRLFGYAGSGKSTVLKFALDELGLSPHRGAKDGTCVPGVVTATFTGKAALVLTRKGTPARTIHSLIYSVIEATEAEIEAAAQKVREAETAARRLTGFDRTTAEAAIEAMRQALSAMKHPRFALNPQSDAADARLIVLDEVSMVPARRCSDHLAERLERRLKVRLAGRGSTLWRLTWKRHLTPSRRPICRLRASALRISASGCSSAPSPSGQHMAGWATASARDYKDGSECPAVPINALLGRQVWLAGWPTAMAGSPATERYNAAGNTDASRRTVKLVDWSKALTPPGPARRTASGEIRTGSSAAMTAGGPLSPEHSRWLMGYPVAWGCCGATAMRSCRRSRRSS